MLNPDLRTALEKAGVVSLWWLAVPFVLCAALARWRRRWAAPFAVACAGFAGMLFEIVILFAFQVLHGTLYAEVGLIVAAYMGGLALGASVANRLAMANGRWQTANGRWRMADGGRQTAGGETSVKEGKKAPGEVRRERWGTDRTALLVVLGLAVAFACVIPLLLTHPGSLPAPAFWLMALIAGCLGGMVYPLAISTRTARRRATTGMRRKSPPVGSSRQALRR